MADRRTVLVTGANGLIGRVVRERLADRYALRALVHRDEGDLGIPTHLGDIADLGAIAPAFAGVDSVVHLAGEASVDGGWESILPANLVGVRNVYEAAHRSGCRRVVFASSNHLMGLYAPEVPGARRHPPQEGVTADAEPRPDSLYGASKGWGEVLGRYYAEVLGLSVVALRIGWVTDDDHPAAPGPDTPADQARLMRRGRGMYLSQRDCASLIAAAIEAPDDLRFAAVYGVSDNAGRWFSLQPAESALGWRPQDGVGPAA